MSSAETRITEEEIKQILDLKGKARGQAIKNAIQAMIFLEGKEGFEKFLEEMKRIGYWLNEYEDHNNIKIFNWYPLWQDVLPIVVAARFFNWDEKKLEEFGRCNQRVSFFERVLLKYFVSLKMVFQLTGERWSKHYNVGVLEPIKFDEINKQAIIRLKDFPAHSIFCTMLNGYFESATGYLTSSRNVNSVQTECPNSGGKYHEYIISWK